MIAPDKAWAEDEFYESEYGEDSFIIETMNDMSPWLFVVDRFTSLPIEKGSYTIHVSPPFGLTAEAEFEITCTLFSHEQPTPLPAAEIKSGAIRRETGFFESYSIEVPKGATSLRIDLFDTRDDLVLLAKRGKRPARVMGNIGFVNDSRGRKSLIINEKSRPRLRPGTWHLDVADPQNAERTANYKLHVSFENKPPIELLQIPALPERHGPGALGASLAAVVELSTGEGGGSATFINETGRLLTNAHVVSLPDGTPTKRPVIVSVTLDPRHPPVELFKARVTQFDLSRDLAILELVEGYYNQPLAADLRTPSAPLASPRSTEMTEGLWIAGYPWTGGLGARVSLSVTRGVVTGFDLIQDGAAIKTDAEISSGNSGGAAFDDMGRLIGVPTATIGESGDKIGYIHPIELIPAQWLLP
jgi:hypothetical protein